MATPIGHSLVAGLFYYYDHEIKQIDLPLIFFCILFANAPDLDFLPGIIIGSPGYFHHQFSHSFVFGLLFSVLVCIILKRYTTLFSSWPVLPLMCLGYFLYLSHLFVDYITLDNGIPYGMPLFWPFSDYYLNAPVYVFSNVLHSNGVFNIHNLKVALNEVVVFSPPLVFLLFVHKRFNRISNSTRTSFLLIIMLVILSFSLNVNPHYK